MKKTLLTAILLGASVAASAQELTFAMEPSYPPLKPQMKKARLLVLMSMWRMQFVKKSKQPVNSKAKLLMH